MVKPWQKVIQLSIVFYFALTTILPPSTAIASTTLAAPTSSTSVLRLGGIDQYETAAKIAKQGWTGTTENVVLSSGINSTLVDALAAGPLAAKLKAPILLTDGGNRLNLYAKAELERLKPKKVYITSGTAVIKPAVINELKALGMTPVPLGGYDRYETSVNIAKELATQGVDSSRVILAAGWLSPADALSVAPIAAAQEMPILTTTQGQLPASVKTYLESIKAKVTESYVVGGSAVVSDTVKGQLPGKVSRYSGLTKYDTNLQILKNFANDYKNDHVYVANGETLVDALAGVPLAAANQAPLVLVNQQLDNATKDFVKLNLSTAKMVALGGEAVVPSTGMNQFTSLMSYSEANLTVGSTDAANPVKLTDNVRLSGNNLTLENANADYSVYVQGDNITLSHLNVRGTVFVDPGDNGSATLDGVTAGKIVILSGAKDSVHLKNTKAGVLTVDSRSSNVRIESTGTTTIGNSVVRSFAIIDIIGGSLGEVSILSAPGRNPMVELKGTFTQPVVLNDQVQVHLSASAVITDLIANSKASLIVDQGAKVTHFDNKGNAVTITGTGAKAIPESNPIAPGGSTGTPTTQNPTAPTTPTVPTTPTAPRSVTLSNLGVVTNPANSFGPYENGAEIDLSGLADEVRVLGFTVTADQDCILQFKVLGNVQTIELEKGQERVVEMGDLILGGSIPGGVTMADFRALYETQKTKTLVGTVLINEEIVGKLTVKLRFLK